MPVQILTFVGEGLTHISTLCFMEIVIKGQNSCHDSATPRQILAKLLKAANVLLLKALPYLRARVFSKKSSNAGGKPAEIAGLHLAKLRPLGWNLRSKTGLTDRHCCQPN